MVVGRKQSTTSYAQRIGDMHTYDGRCCFIKILTNMHDNKNLKKDQTPIVCESRSLNIAQFAQTFHRFAEFFQFDEDFVVDTRFESYADRFTFTAHSAAFDFEATLEVKKGGKA